MALESRIKLTADNFSPQSDLIEVFSKKAGVVGVINPSQIASPPSGGAGAIQFSDGSAFASDASNLFWDNTNKRLGIGTNTPTQPLSVNGQILSINGRVSTGTTWIDYDGTFRSQWGWLKLSSSGDIRLLNNASIGGDFVPTATTHIKGSGSTGATTSLLVQNSAATESFKVTDDGIVWVKQTIGFLTNPYFNFITSNFGGVTFDNDGLGSVRCSFTNGRFSTNDKVGFGAYNNTSSRVLILGSGSTAATTSLLVQNSAGTAAMTIKDDLTTTFGGSVGSGTNNGVFGDIILDYQSGTRRIRPGGNSLDLTDVFGNKAFQVNQNAIPRIALDFDGVTFCRNIVSLQYTAGSTQQTVLTSSNYLGHLTPFFDIKATGYANSTNTALRLYTDNTTSGTYGNIIIGHNGTNATGNIGIGTSSPTARLQVQGSGSTSATTSLLVQNSSGDPMLTITDDKNINIGNNAKINLVYPNTITYHNTYDFYITPTNGTQTGNIILDSSYVRLLGSGNIGVTISGSGSDTIIKKTQAGSDSTRYLNISGSDQTNPAYLGKGGVVRIYGGLNNGIAEQGLVVLAHNGTTTQGAVVVGGTSADTSALVDIQSTTRGFLKPRMTTTQKNAIASPTAGLEVFDTTLGRPCFYNGSAWVTL